MGSNNNDAYPEITGSVSDRKTNYYHMIFNAGFLPDGKRNRASESTGLTLKGNQRKANNMLIGKINDLTEARAITGIAELKELLELLKVYPNVDDLKIAKENEAVSAAPPDIPEEDPGPLYNDVIDQFLRYHATRVKGNTILKYQYAAAHVKEFFAEKLMKEVTSLDIAKYFTYKSEGDAEKGIEPLLPSTLADHRSVISMSCKYARRIMKVIKENPAEDVLSPKVVVGSPDFFREEELNLVFEKIMGNPIAPAVILAGAFGLRRQEAVGAKWNAIDLESNTVTIRHTVTLEGSKEVAADTTKSASSFRTLILLQDIKPFFVALKDYQKASCKMCGRPFSEDSYICVWPDGRRLRVGHVTRKWADFLAANHMRHIRYHDLRHSSASLLRRSGLSLLEIKDWLGHADIKTTARYAHLGMEERQQRVAEKVAGKLHIKIDEKNAS